MNHRKDACKLNPASVELPEDASLSAVRIFIICHLVRGEEV